MALGTGRRALGVGRREMGRARGAGGSVRVGRAWGAGRHSVMGARFLVRWREAMPPAVVEVGCSQVHPV